MQVVPTRSLCKTSEELASSKENNSKGRAHSRLSQHCRRQGIEGQARLFRLGSELEILLDANDQNGSVYDRPFANRITKFPGFVVTNPIQNGGNRCPDSALIKRSGLCFSPIQFHSQMLEKGNTRESNNNLGMPSLANSALVCPIPPTGSGHTHALSHNIRALNTPSGSTSSTGEKQNTLPCGLECVRQDLLTKGLSGQAAGFVLAAQRASTQNQYKSCWSM